MACTGESREWAMVGREFSRLAAFLQARGYVEDGEGGGSFAIVGQDGAPGWGEWMYWVVVHEDPTRPVLAEAEALLGIR